MYGYGDEYETDVVEIRHWTDMTTRAAISKAKKEHFQDGWELLDTDYGGGLGLPGGGQLRGTQVVRLYFRRRRSW